MFHQTKVTFGESCCTAGVVPPYPGHVAEVTCCEPLSALPGQIESHGIFHFCRSVKRQRISLRSGNLESLRKVRDKRRNCQNRADLKFSPKTVSVAFNVICQVSTTT